MKEFKLSGTNDSVYYECIKSNLEVYMIPTKNKSGFNITLNVKYGSTITDFKDNTKKKSIHLPNGCAHFLEHLMFKMSDGSDATSKFYELGTDSNAFTSYYQTAYTVNSVDNFKENLNILLDFVYSPYFTKENVKDEKGIISSEINMTDDDLNSKMFHALNANLFVKSNLKYKVAGEVDDVQATSLEDIETAYQYFYHPKNMFLVITGSFNHEEALAIIEKNMSKKEFKEAPNFTIKSIKEPMKVLNDFVIVKGDSKKVMFGCKFPLPIKEMDERLLYNYIDVIVSSNLGRTSDFQNKLLSGNLIDRPLSIQISFSDNFFVLYIIAETEYRDRLLTLFQEKIKNLILTSEELERKIRVMKSNYILSTDDLEIMNSYIQSEIIKFGNIDFDIYDKLSNMNIDEANKVIKNINLKNMVMVVCEKTTKKKKK